MNPWSARCGESRTPGAEGGPGKRTSGNTGTAPGSDPYTEHPTREGKLYCCGSYSRSNTRSAQPRVSCRSLSPGWVSTSRRMIATPASVAVIPSAAGT